MKKLYITLITLLLIFILILLTINFSKAANITSVQSGNWSNKNTWDCSCVPGAGDNVIISTHIITVNNNYSVTDLDITTGGLLTSGGRKLTITGNLTLNGAVTGNVKIDLSGTNTIDGSGVLSTNGNVTFIGGNKIISAGTSVDNSAATLSTITIDAGVTVTNNGFWISGAKIMGNAASSTWIQGPNSSLRVGDELLLTGTLDASGSGNTIEYYQDGDQSIKTASGAYHNLILSGSGNKNMAANLNIDGDLSILSGVLDPNNFDVNIAGDWSNSGGLTEGTGLVIFDGTLDQSVTVAGGETYYGLQINKSGGEMVCGDDINVTNTLTMISGNIDMGSNTLTLGTDTSNAGTLTYTSGNVIGKLKRWINSAGPTNWPVGTHTDSRLANPNIPPKGTGVWGTWTWEFIEADPGTNGYSFVDGSTYYNPFSEGYWKSTGGDGFALNPSITYTMGLTSTGMTSFTLDNSTLITFRTNSASAWVGTGGPNGFFNPFVTSTTLDNSYVTGEWCFSDDTNCLAPTTPVITGSNAVCTNDIGEIYSVTDIPLETYTWTVSGGTIMSGQSTSSITVDWGATGMEGSVEVVATNGCTSTFTVTYAVDIGPLPTSSITGNTAVPDLTTGEPYSVLNEAGYTYTWTITGGTLASGQGTNSITVNWGPEGDGEVRVIGSNGCGSAALVDIDITIYDAIESSKTGNFGNNNTWICSCTPGTTESIRIMPAHAVRLTGNETIANLIIEPGGVLNLSGNNLTVTQNITMNGFVILSGDIILSGNNTNIDGVGLFINTGDISITGGGKTILSSSALSKFNGDLTIANNITITNNGVFTLNGSLTGGNVNSRVINEENSTINITGTLLSTGTLISSANFNTVNYTGLVDQSIYPTTYYNVGFYGDGIKSIDANTVVNGELQIADDASLDVTASNYTINVGGDWINTSADADPFIERTSSVTFDGSSIQILIASGGEFFDDFTMNNASGVLLDDQLTISGQLTFSNGIINTSAGNELIIADNATTTTASDASHIDGPMDKIGDDAFVFPVGDIGNYQAIEISAPGATSDRFQAQYFQTGHANQTIMDGTLDHVSALEYWDLSLITGSPTINVTLHWDLYSEASTVPGEINDLRAAHELVGNWSDEGNDGTTWNGSNGTIVVNGISSFSPWTLASISSNNPLPITLIDFYAKQREEFVDIKWSTAKEINNDYFTIEKRNKFDNDFMPIGSIEGHGNSTSTNYYSFQDTYPLPGFNYYRLKQTDFSGEYTYSKIIVVQVDDFSKFVLYPNPSQGILNIKVPKMGGTRTLKIFDQFGAQIVSKVLKNREDYISIHSGFDEGFYIVRVTDGFQSFNQKFIVNK